MVEFVESFVDFTPEQVGAWQGLVDALRGYDAGADAYLTKPSDAAVLIRTLDSLLAKVQSRKS